MLPQELFFQTLTLKAWGRGLGRENFTLAEANTELLQGMLAEPIGCEDGPTWLYYGLKGAVPPPAAAAAAALAPAPAAPTAAPAPYPRVSPFVCFSAKLSFLKSTEWVRARAGSVGRLGISNRDFARLGLLYLHNGSWDGRRLISPEHVRLVTAAYVAPSPVGCFSV